MTTKTKRFDVPPGEGHQLTLANDAHTGLLLGLEISDGGDGEESPATGYGLRNDTIPVRLPFVWPRGSELVIVLGASKEKRRISVTPNLEYKPPSAPDGFPCGITGCRKCKAPK